MATNRNSATTEPRRNWLITTWNAVSDLIFAPLFRFLTEPHQSVTDVGEKRRAQLLATITLILVAAFTWAIFSNPSAIRSFIALFVITLISYVLSRTRYYRVGTYFFSFGITALAFISLYLGTASSFDTAISSIAHISLIIASILLSLRGFSILVFLSTIAAFSARSYSQTPINAEDGFFRVAGVFLSIGVILIGATLFRARVERDRLKQVQDINSELEDITNKLEQRVEERTAELAAANVQTSQRATQLQTITELSESIAQLQDLNDIFTTATNLISERFGFYHVGIFLVDQNHEYTILQAANSEGGKRMLDRRHRLKFGTGVVGVAAQSGRPRIALDVGADAVFFDNPDLPNTRSEVALPLKARGETIGVLDVQSTQAGAFTHEDLQLLTTLANQVSISLENARLLTETRSALAQIQEVYDEYTRAEWGHTVTNIEQPGFRYRTGHVEIMESALYTPEVLAAVQQGEIIAGHPNGSEDRRSTVAIPVKLRGEVIGVLQIESNDSSKEWEKDEVGLVAAVAERAAVAMENARLFQEARRRAAKEHTISEASARIGSALNIENILYVTAEELERVLGGSEIVMQLESEKPQGAKPPKANE
ncbi:MAG: GAF domain-containing protein [Chloroflexota bacterium]|nr:GAF domain-containing protein [Chloroflexota bacterium]